MRAKFLTLLLPSLLLLRGCATVTPEQAQAYGNAAHTVIHGGLQDYKTIVEIRRAR